MPYRRKGSPYLHYDFVVAGTRYHGSTKKKTLAEARRVESALRRKAEASGAAAVGAAPTMLDEAPPTLAQTIEAYKATHPAEAERTTVMLRYLGYAARAVGGDLPFREIDEGKVGEVAAWVAAKPNGRTPGVPVGPATVTKALSCLQTLIVWQCERSETPMPPIRWKKFMRPAEKREREIDFAEEFDIDAVQSEDDRDIRVVLVATTLRVGNVIGLRWKEVDMEDQEVKVFQKGGIPIVQPFDDEVRSIFEARRGHHPEFVFTYVAKRRLKTVGGLVERGERFPVQYPAFRNRWHRAVKAAASTAVPHDTRHTGAIRTLRNSNSLEDAQQTLNHKRVETTQIYTELAEQDIRRAIAALDLAEMEAGASFLADHVLSMRAITRPTTSGNPASERSPPLGAAGSATSLSPP